MSQAHAHIVRRGRFGVESVFYRDGNPSPGAARGEPYGAAFDQAGDALASHRQWVFSNDAHLEGPDRKAIVFETFETTAQSKNEVGLAYRFHTSRPLGELSFVYATPGLIVSREFEYELKEIKLP